METLSWILLYLILPIVLGVLGNLATPWVKTLLTKGNLSVRERRVSSLKKEYTKILKYVNAPSLLTHYLIVDVMVMFLVLIGVILSVSYLAFSILLQIINSGGQVPNVISLPLAGSVGLIAFLAVATYIGFGAVDIKNKVRFFNQYKEETTKKLIKLGGNPEDLRNLQKVL